MNPERHEMVSKYLKCECKNIECSLKYQYRHCNSVDEWQLFREGMHQYVPGVVIKKRGVPLQIVRLIEGLISTNPDIKPKEVLNTITLNRKANFRRRL